jgi:hypothetical protein
MGDFFSAPSPAPAPPPPQPAAAPDPNAEAAAQRQETLERNRRGLAGLIATSDKGELNAPLSQGKSLLGE